MRLNTSGIVCPRPLDKLPPCLSVHQVYSSYLAYNLAGVKYEDLTKRQKHTTGGIPRWSPTLVLVARFSAYVRQSGRDAQFSLTYGRMCLAAFLAQYVSTNRRGNGEMAEIEGNCSRVK